MSCCHRVCSFLWFCYYSSCQTRTLRLSLRWASAFSRRQLHCSTLVEASTLHWTHSCLLMSRTHLPVGWWPERQQQWQVLVARPMDWHIAVIEQTLELVISHLIPAEMIALVRQFAPTSRTWHVHVCVVSLHCEHVPLSTDGVHLVNRTWSSS